MAARRVTGKRISPHVISRGVPSNQAARTRTFTGSMRTMAIEDSSFAFAGGRSLRARERQNGRSTYGARLVEQTFDVKIDEPFVQPPRNPGLTPCQLACHEIGR